MVIRVDRLMVIMVLAVWCCQSGRAEVLINQRIVPGRTFLVSDGTTYDAGERFLVSQRHEIPDDMVVQGDTVLLTATGDGLDQATSLQWRLIRAWGTAKLTPDPQDPRIARFVADGYGVNEIAFEAVVNGSRVLRGTNVFVEFSTDNMLVTGEPVSLPTNAEQNPFIDQVNQKVQDHREQCTARNPHNGRLVTFWQVKFGTHDDHPMAVATMTSEDRGLTWKNKQYLYRHAGDNSGWGSICWSPGGNGGQGEFLLWTCSHVRSPDNRIMLFRSRDDGQSWQHVGDYQQAIARTFGRPNALLTYFGVNRTIRTVRGALVSPMVCSDGVRTIRSEDNGETWHGSNLDKSFPQGNEDALVETIDGGRLILMARPGDNGLHNRRFESVDGGKTWSAKQDTTLPTARVNFGLDKIVEPGTPEHGRVVYASAATRTLNYGRHQLVVAVNRDPIAVSRNDWDVRLLWDTLCNYADVLYLPDDKSLLVTVETLFPGRTNHSCATIRYFKMSLRYWRALPPFAPAGGRAGSRGDEAKVLAPAQVP
ncbi:MAG: exo-alpha-sialidase [Pirellulales bacterium]|nr:exo-alpha-sialidase [Pirellulales bacterium]